MTGQKLVFLLSCVVLTLVWRADSFQRNNPITDDGVIFRRLAALLECENELVDE